MSVRFITEVAQPHALASFEMAMVWLRDRLGIVDFMPGGAHGGDYLNIPRSNEISGFEVDSEALPVQPTVQIVDAVGGSDASAAPAEQAAPSHRVEIAVVRNLELNIPGGEITTEDDRAGADSIRFSAEAGYRIGIKAAQRVIQDVLAVCVAAADGVKDDHDYEPYMDDVKSEHQVCMNARIIELGKRLMGDEADQMDVGIAHWKQWTDYKPHGEYFYAPRIVYDLFYFPEFHTVDKTNWMVLDAIGVTKGPDPEVSPQIYQSLLLRSKRKHPDGLAPVVISIQKPLHVFEQSETNNRTVTLRQPPEISYAIGVRGKAWNQKDGRANPNDEAIMNPDNWLDVYLDAREVGVILLRTN